jgi:hypothetical protein
MQTPTVGHADMIARRIMIVQNHKAPGHQSTATGSNQMGVSTKDKEYLKWN